MPDDPHPITVTCRLCGDPCKRSPLNGQWYHLDDEVYLTTGESNLTHHAEPDVIDL